MTHAHPGSRGRMLRRFAGLAALGFLIAAGSAEAHPRHRGHKHKHWKHRHAPHTVVVREAPCAVAPVVYAPVTCAPVAYHRVWRPGYWQTAQSGFQVWVPGAMVAVSF